ncbi:MAG: transposase, partial [Nitrososphaerota archaeon]|nr:transposase [Nitrososphaerota archaeon]
MDIKQLVFLDECSINCYTRLYGWGDKHAKVEEYVPDVRFERTSILSALRLSGVNAQVSFKGTLNGEFFGLYVKYVLAPMLNEGM